MPLAVQRWNVYRNRVLAVYFSNAGIDVIPSVGWSDERSYTFCFEGLPRNSTIAISTNGCLSTMLGNHYFMKGFERMLKIIKPVTVLNYGRVLQELSSFNKINLINYDSYSQKLKISVPRGTPNRRHHARTS